MNCVLKSFSKNPSLEGSVIETMSNYPVYASSKARLIPDTCALTRRTGDGPRPQTVARSTTITARCLLRSFSVFLLFLGSLIYLISFERQSLNLVLYPFKGLVVFQMKHSYKCRASAQKKGCLFFRLRQALL